MNNYKNMFIGILVILVFALGVDALCVVDETQQVVITQFGQPIGNPIQTSGLHFKCPVLQVANYFDKRLLEWDGKPTQIPTLNKRYIWVDTTARWRIVNPLKFMQTVGTERGAHAQLDAIIGGATFDAVSNVVLVEAIRNSNRLVEVTKDNNISEELEEFEVNKEALEEINVGREDLTRDILARSSRIVADYGIELVDVLIKRINYVQEVREKVYERMISERNRAAEQYRSEGQGKKAEIEGQMIKELRDIRSGAYKEAQEIKGSADAEAIAIYAEAYNKDPDFYSFIKTLETYKKTINQESTLILSTDSDYYKYFKTMDFNKYPIDKNQ